MKKHENSSVCIKQIMFTALFLVVATFGGLNAYRIVYDKNAETIPAIESASVGGDAFETALVENTEDDIYSERIKFLAVTVIEDVSGETLKTEKDLSDSISYNEKVISRGNFVREQVASEILSNATKDMNETKEKQNNEINDNKLLNTVINEIRELGEFQETIMVDEKSNSGDSAKVEKDEEFLNSNQEVVTEIIEPVAEIVETKEKSLGTDENIVAQETIVTSTENLTPPIEYVRTIDVKATAYCLCKKCCGKSPSNPGYGVTASGLKITPGAGMKVVASDPNVIPLGTNVYIEGLYGARDYGYAVVADTGSAIKNLKIDLYMDTHQMALNWGVKSVRVYILAD